MNAEGGEETVSKIGEMGGAALVVKGDVSKAEDNQNAVEQAVAAYGRLDYSFNNAAFMRPGPREATHEYDEDHWDRMIAVLLKGVWLGMKYQIRQMLKQGGGAIVNTSSIVGLIGSLDCAYGAAKHGVIGLTKTAALEYAKQGIRVNAVCPGFIQTPRMDRFAADAPERVPDVIAKHPIGRIGEPEEVAEAVVWLCSDAASFVTGHAMAVDGGYLAQ